MQTDSWKSKVESKHREHRAWVARDFPWDLEDPTFLIAWPAIKDIPSSYYHRLHERISVIKAHDSMIAAAWYRLLNPKIRGTNKLRIPGRNNRGNGKTFTSNSRSWTISFHPLLRCACRSRRRRRHMGFSTAAHMVGLPNFQIYYLFNHEFKSCWSPGFSQVKGTLIFSASLFAFSLQSCFPLFLQLALLYFFCKHNSQVGVW